MSKQLITSKDFQLFKLTGLVIYVSGVLFLAYLVLSESVADVIFSISAVPWLGYSILLFILSFVFLALSLYKNRTYTPSIFLFAFFLIVPIIGHISYQIFIDLHGDFFGKQVSLEYPLFVWSVGTAVFFAGVLLPHLFPSLPRRNVMATWDAPRAMFLLWLFLGISLTASLVVVAKIGYLPIFHSGIDEVRESYEQIAGRFTSKFSRLFVIASLLAAVMLFLSKYKKTCLIFYFMSLLGSALYGERMYLFWALIFFFLIYLKFHKPTKRQVLIFMVLACSLLALFVIIAENRAGRLDEGVTLKESIILPLFSEYSYYAYVVDEISESGRYLKGDIFWGALVLIFPRQIWALFDIDKDYVMQKYSAVHFFGKWFNDRYGTRITPIGEAYAGYGLLAGVCFQMFAFGLIFGVLERVYLKLSKENIWLGFVCFLISLFMWLPLATLNAIVDPMIYFGSILLVCQMVAAKKVLIAREENSIASK